MSNVRNVGDSPIAGCRYMLDGNDGKVAYAQSCELQCECHN